MDDEVDDFEPVVSRLHSVGQQPVDSALQHRVLAKANRSRTTWLHSTKLKVAAALAGGFMIGSVSLASAGNLPGPAQDVARAALGVFGVDVPPGHDRYNGPECGGATNHGKYVEAHPDDPAAAKSPCGKPNKSVNKKSKDVTATDPAGTTGKPGHGRPPWAGQGKEKNKDKKADDDESETTDSEPVTPADPVQTTTTVAAATTTTVAAQPTTTTLLEEPTTTTSGTNESTTSTTTESTTSSTTTTT